MIPLAENAPVWAVVLEWLLDRSEVGVTTLDFLQNMRHGHLIGASYTQRISQIREMLEPDFLLQGEVVKAFPNKPDGKKKRGSIFKLDPLYHVAAKEALRPHRAPSAALAAGTSSPTTRARAAGQ